MTGCDARELTLDAKVCKVKASQKNNDSALKNSQPLRPQDGPSPTKNVRQPGKVDGTGEKSEAEAVGTAVEGDANSAATAQQNESESPAGTDSIASSDIPSCDSKTLPSMGPHLLAGLEEDHFCAPVIKKINWKREMVLTALNAIREIGGHRCLSLRSGGFSFSPLAVAGCMDVNFEDIIDINYEVFLDSSSVGKKMGRFTGDIKFKVPSMAVCEELVSANKSHIGTC